MLRALFFVLLEALHLIPGSFFLPRDIKTNVKNCLENGWEE